MMELLDKFKSLPNINEYLKHDKYGMYTPCLCKLDDQWAILWQGDVGVCAFCITADSIEQVISDAYDYCLNNNPL